MNSINIIKPLLCPLSSWELRESNPGQLVEKRECYLCAMLVPFISQRRALFSSKIGYKTRRRTQLHHFMNHPGSWADLNMATKSRNFQSGMESNSLWLDMSWMILATWYHSEWSCDSKQTSRIFRPGFFWFKICSFLFIVHLQEPIYATCYPIPTVKAMNGLNTSNLNQRSTTFGQWQ